jgi:hypothetical protein
MQLSFNEAIDRISANATKSYIWFDVVTASGNYLQLGGTSSEIKAEVLQVENGKVVKYQNGCPITSFSLTYDRSYSDELIVETSSKRAVIKFKKDFLELLDTPNLNLFKLEFEPIYEKVISGYSLKTKL